MGKTAIPIDTSPARADTSWKSTAELTTNVKMAVKRGMLLLGAIVANPHNPSLLFETVVNLLTRETPDDPFPTGGDKGRPTTVSS